MQKSLYDVRFFQEENCNTDRFRLQNIKEKAKKCKEYGKEKTVENELKINAHSGSGFDSRTILNILPRFLNGDVIMKNDSKTKLKILR